MTDPAEVEPRPTEVPASFRRLTPKERRELERAILAEQAALFEEPDHSFEIAVKQTYEERRGPAKRDAFLEAIRQRRLEREGHTRRCGVWDRHPCSCAADEATPPPTTHRP
jgi:hypothetical protein